MRLLIAFCLISLHAVSQKTIHVPCMVKSETVPYTYQSGTDSTSYDTVICTTAKKCNFWCRIGFSRPKYKTTCDTATYYHYYPHYTTVEAHDTMIQSTCDSTVWVTNFGVIILGSGLMPKDNSVLAKSLSVGVYRGGSVALRDYAGGFLYSYKYYADAGLKVFPNVSWEPQGTSRLFMTNPKLFATRLGTFLKLHKDYLNGFVAVYNEEDNKQPAYFYGSVAPYIPILKQCVDTGLTYGINVTNGGLHIAWLSYKLAQDYKQRGLTDSLNWIMSVSFTPQMKAVWNGKKNQFYDLLMRSDTLYNGYISIPEMKYMNMHLYETATWHITTDLLNAFSGYIYRTSKKIMISNETGIRDTISTSILNGVLQAYDKANVPIVIYLSGAGENNDTQLINLNNATLNQWGIQFSGYMKLRQQ